jgi:hypothetical protein
MKQTKNTDHVCLEVQGRANIIFNHNGATSCF